MKIHTSPHFLKHTHIHTHTPSSQTGTSFACGNSYLSVTWHTHIQPGSPYLQLVATAVTLLGLCTEVTLICPLCSHSGGPPAGQRHNVKEGDSHHSHWKELMLFGN